MKENTTTVSEAIVDYINAIGAEYVFGMAGANIEDFVIACDRSDKITPIVAKHEAAAINMAQGYYLKSGKLGVVYTTSGGGAFNTVSPLTEALGSAIPMLIIIGQIPINNEGKGHFQDSSGNNTAINAENIFAEVSVFCKKIKRASEALDEIHFASTLAIERKGPSVLLLPADIQKTLLKSPPLLFPERHTSSFCLEAEKLDRIISLISQNNENPLIIAGEALLGLLLEDELQTLASRLNAKVLLTPEAKGLMGCSNPHFQGLIGVMGHSNVIEVAERCSICIILGTRLPLLARYDIEAALTGKNIIHINNNDLYVSYGACVEQVLGPIEQSLPYIINHLPSAGKVNKPSSNISYITSSSPASINNRNLTYIEAFEQINHYLDTDADIFVDAGNTGAAATHYLKMKGKGIFSIALSMGGMGYSFGAAMGAAFHTKKRTYILAGDGAFYMHGLELHTAIEHDLPIVMIIFNNNAHGMCEIREQLYYSTTTKTNSFKDAHIAKGIQSLFPEATGYEVACKASLEHALKAANSTSKISCISISIDANEMPPFLPFLHHKSIIGEPNLA